MRVGGFHSAPLVRRGRWASWALLGLLVVPVCAWVIAGHFTDAILACVLLAPLFAWAGLVATGSAQRAAHATLTYDALAGLGFEEISLTRAFPTQGVTGLPFALWTHDRARVLCAGRGIVDGVELVIASVSWWDARRAGSPWKLATIAVARVPQPVANLVRGFSIHRSFEVAFEGAHFWTHGGRTWPMTSTESSEFDDRWRTRLAPGADELPVKQLLAPDVIDALISAGPGDLSIQQYREWVLVSDLETSAAASDGHTARRVAHLAARFATELLAVARLPSPTVSRR